MDLAELKETFALFDDWEDKYRFVMDLGKTSADMSESDKVEENLIRGCQSQVWLTHTLTAEGTLEFCLDSDAFIVRGLISIVLLAYHGKTPAEILAFDIEGAFNELELLQHLSLTRGNGLRAMIQRIREIAQTNS